MYLQKFKTIVCLFLLLYFCLFSNIIQSVCKRINICIFWVLILFQKVLIFLIHIKIVYGRVAFSLLKHNSDAQMQTNKETLLWERQRVQCKKINSSKYLILALESRVFFTLTFCRKYKEGCFLSEMKVQYHNFKIPISSRKTDHG